MNSPRRAKRAGGSLGPRMDPAGVPPLPSQGLFERNSQYLPRDSDSGAPLRGATCFVVPPGALRATGTIHGGRLRRPEDDLRSGCEFRKAPR